MSDIERHLDDRYSRSFGRVAGYLPKNRTAVDEFLIQFSEGLAKQPITSPAVASLKRLIEADGVVRMYVEQMIEQVDEKHRHIKNIPELLAALDKIVRGAPVYNRDPAHQIFFPMSTLFTYMMMTPAGEAAFRNTEFNNAIRAILQEWCKFLDSPESRSVLNEGEHGWLSQPAFQQNNLSEFVIPDRRAPHWGFASFNAYFHREIRKEFRPVSGPDNPKVIVSPNDGSVVTWQTDVHASARFWLKGQPYSLHDMLHGHYVDRFTRGAVFQSFLSGADYHRWHSPIAGTVAHVEKVDGLMFSDAESAGPDPTAATYSQGYEASVNTRGLVFVQSPDPAIGMVCVIPIGITEISSVSFSVKKGDHVAKGAELGYFSYGGSSMAIVFQPGTIRSFTVPQNHTGNQDNGAPIFVNAQLAFAN
ncbi:MAG TPA: phosphatidylserine decarboxylase family protein [Candidatus Saccharimonadales bacterium]|jgi:phosphatidylserine decarboxylase|nr:phosphatidylserine decarboxylase family protein [Candidatus Saccharimonadales bacterium]